MKNLWYLSKFPKAKFAENILNLRKLLQTNFCPNQNVNRTTIFAQSNLLDLFSRLKPKNYAIAKDMKLTFNLKNR